jgi:hypothetical protein
MRSKGMRLTAIAAALIAAFGSILVIAQRQRASPHETVEVMLNGKRVSISYGRPYAKGRKIMGALVPYDKVWRTGADEATKLTTETDLMIGNISVPPGSYSIFTLPSASGWKIIVNKVADQWGAFQYNAGEDVGRADMKVRTLGDPVEQFTIKLSGSGKSGTLTMAWETTEASIAIEAK